jgi:hypothetical protein
MSLTNPVGTAEKRQEWRERYEANGWHPEVLAALNLLDKQEDGLDIAEKVIDHYRGHHIVCERARRLLEQWDAWKGES